MDGAARVGRVWAADEFLLADQDEFPDAAVELRSVGVSLPMAEVYALAVLPERPGET